MNSQTYKLVKDFLSTKSDNFKIKELYAFYDKQAVNMSGVDVLTVKRLFKDVESTILSSLKDSFTIPDIIAECKRILRRISNDVRPSNHNANYIWMMNVLTLCKLNGMPYDDDHGIILIYKENGTQVFIN